MAAREKPRNWGKALIAFTILAFTSSVVFPFLEKLADEHGAFKHPTNQLIQFAETVITVNALLLAFVARHYGALITLAVGLAAGLALGVRHGPTVRRVFVDVWRTVGGGTGEPAGTDVVLALKDEAVRIAGSAADGTVLLTTLAASAVIPSDTTSFQRRSFARLAGDELIAEGLAVDPTGRGEVFKLQPGGLIRRGLKSPSDHPG
ncbi:MAG: hypothetical protein PSV23_15905 [Brevundimonas sp.]|uniref:hypothetical protein n=1 Tax=Brevundimonas sp. TaxID=1871086 RepID=UPI0024884855|nr:hypothetical protein [Brevundimonas sp.]MDI1328278.1 hypothetical protein [Brevundimonas sp.]